MQESYIAQWQLWSQSQRFENRRIRKQEFQAGANRSKVVTDRGEITCATL